MKAFVVFGTLSFIIASVVFDGYALSVLWEWFVVPVFHQPQLSVVSAIGIALVVNYFTIRQAQFDCQEKERSPEERFARTVIFAILKPVTGLSIGWIVHLFM